MMTDSDKLISVRINKDMDLHKVNDQSCASRYPSHYPQGTADCAFITKKVEILVQIARSIVNNNRRWSCCICTISFNK